MMKKKKSMKWRKKEVHPDPRTQRKRQSRKMRVMMTKARSRKTKGQVLHTARQRPLQRPSRDLEMAAHKPYQNLYRHPLLKS